MRISCDFDNVLDLSEQDYPYCHKPNIELIEKLKQRQLNGDKLILNTLRESKILKIAVAFLEYHGLYFDRINDNLIEDILKWGYNPRKISADIYIDDRNVNWKEFIKIK